MNNILSLNHFWWSYCKKQRIKKNDKKKRKSINKNRETPIFKNILPHLENYIV